MSRDGVEHEHLEPRREIGLRCIAAGVGAQDIDCRRRGGPHECRASLDHRSRRAGRQAGRDLDRLAHVARRDQQPRLDAAYEVLYGIRGLPVADGVDRSAQRLERASRALARLELRESRKRGDLQPHRQVARGANGRGRSRERRRGRRIAPEVLGPRDGFEREVGGGAQIALGGAQRRQVPETADDHIVLLALAREGDARAQMARGHRPLADPQHLARSEEHESEGAALG